MSHRMSAAEYRKLITDQPADSQNGRYGANKRIKTADGKFDSKAEWKRWEFLILMEKLGEISDLKRQAPYSFDHDGEHICTYVADFQYHLKDGTLIVEDMKGKIITPEFNLKRKLMKAFYKIVVIVVTRVREEPGTPSPLPRKNR